MFLTLGDGVHLHVCPLTVGVRERVMRFVTPWSNCGHVECVVHYIPDKPRELTDARSNRRGYNQRTGHAMTTLLLLNGARNVFNIKLAPGPTQSSQRCGISARNNLCNLTILFCTQGGRFSESESESVANRGSDSYPPTEF